MAQVFADAKLNKMQGLVRGVVNVKDPTDRRLQACSSLRSFALYPENAQLLAKSVDKLLPTLEQALRDRVVEIRSAVARAIGCIGAAVIVRPLEGHVFVTWVLQNLDPTKKDPARIPLLLAIKEFIEMADRKAVEPYAPALILNVRTYVESLQQVQYLVPSVEVLVVLCQTQTHHFAPHFQDIADLLVGWALDVTFPAKHSKALAELFVAFHPMWAGPNLAFSFDFMSKFLVDMEALADTKPLQVAQIERLLRFLNCFTAVARGVGGQYFAPEIVHEFVVRIFTIFNTVDNQVYHKKWLLYTSETLFIFSQLFGDAFVPHTTPTWQHILDHLSPTPNASMICKICESLLQMLRQQGPRLPIQAIDIFFESAALRSLQTSTNQAVSKAVRLLFEQFLQTPREDIIESVVSHLLRSLKQLRVLLSAHESSKALPARTSSPSTPAPTSTSASVSSTSSPVISPSAPSPRRRRRQELVDQYLFDISLIVFAFLSGKLANAQRERLVQALGDQRPITDPVISRYPVIQLAFLSAFRHMSTSHPHSVVLGAAARHTIVSVLASAVAEWRSPKLRQFALKWLDVLATQHASAIALPGSNPGAAASNVLLFSRNYNVSHTSAQNYIQTNITVPLSLPFVNSFFATCSGGKSLPILHGLLLAAGDKDESVRLAAARILVKLTPNGLFPPEALESIVQASLRRLGDFSKSVRAAYRELLGAVGYSVILNHAALAPAPEEINWKKRLMSANPAEVLFRAHHFQRVMSLLAQRSREHTNDWLLRMFYACQTPSKLGEGLRHAPDRALQLPDLADSSDVLPSFWAMWECARYCILHRLRTPFGGPMQTFEALERMLAAYATGNLAAIPAIPALMTLQSPPPGSALVETQLPPRLLLLLIDHLEKQIYGAYEGSMSIDYHSNKVTTAFFRTNQKVCTDWYARFRQPLIAASVACGATMDIIRHSMKRLSDLRYSVLRAVDSPRLRKVAQDLETSLQNITLALIRQRECDALEGLSVWARTMQELLQNQARAVSSASDQEDAVVPAVAAWMPGAILQSKGFYELAAEEYTRLLLQSPPLLAGGVEFVINQTTDCYARLADWEALNKWLPQIGNYTAKLPVDKPVSPSFDGNYLQALTKFDRGDYGAASAFVDRLELSPTTSKTTFDPFKCLENSEAFLLRALLASKALGNDLHLDEAMRATICRQMSGDLRAARSSIEESLRVTAADSMLQAYPFLVQAHSVDLVERELPQSATSQYLTLPHSDSLDPFIHEAGVWTKILRVCAHKHARQELDDEAFEKLSNSTAKLARKQFNYRLAHRLQTTAGTSSSGSPELILHTAFEAAKLSFAEGRRTEAAIQLWDLTRTSVPREDRSKGALVSKIFLKLAGWLHRDREGLDGRELQSRMVLQTSAHVQTDAVPDLEALSGACLEQATQNDPLCAEAWFAYGSWCYRQGHKVAEQSTVTGGTLELNREEVYRISVIVSRHDDLHGLDTAAQQALITHLSSSFAEFLEKSLHEQNNDYRSEIAEALTTQTPWATPKVVDDLMRVWNDSRKRIFKYYVAACQAYFRFLILRFAPSSEPSHKQERVKSTRPTEDAENSTNGKRNARSYDENITATLRLLRLLVKYGALLQDVLSEGFRATPSSPWKDVVPQLFARLDHPDMYVQQQVLELICKIGEEFPHVIVYPAVVGHAAPSSDLEQKQFTEIITKLRSRNPQLVEEVGSLISELNRITTLWEEEWIATLQMMQVDVSSRLRKLKDEISRVRSNERLEDTEKLRIIGEKYAVIMKPPVVQLERLLATTSVPPQTPHETSFQKTFLQPLTKALDNFRSPANPAHPDAAWAPWKDLYTQLRFFLKATLNLHDISPRLANTKSSIISMPGLHDTDDHKDLVTIQAFESVVAILPTKTKPKKIKMVGSDGKRYSYLLKGREDLHLDERVMQFLAIVNQQLRSDRQSFNRDLRARNYAVIPISRRSGLIQWVEGAIPLYTVYKQWQMRMKTRQPELTILKPTDMFYSKLLPALKERGITNIMSRREWPVDVLKRVFLQLFKETPRSILAQELWCSSTSPAEWWKKTCIYNRSVAVSSMIGYTIGLGDRHLDNILMDFGTGEVVHIDYNVCFEKGLQLKVPERVPFRMTQNMQEALGLTGPEGNFRTACEHVLRVMRKNKETLLTLLEAFVYDPLVDWTADRADDVERRNLELHVSLSLFASRVEEMESVLREHRDQFATTLPKLSVALDTYLCWRNEMVTASSELKEIQHSREQLKMFLSAATAKESEVRPLYEKEAVTERALADEQAKGLEVLKKAHNETRAWQERFTKTIKALRGDLLSALKTATPAETAEHPLQVLSQGTKLLFSLTTPSSEEHKLKDQCADVEAKLNALLIEHATFYHCAMAHIATYREAVYQLPDDYYMLSLCARWSHALSQLIHHPRPEAFTDAWHLLNASGPTEADAQTDRLTERHLISEIEGREQQQGMLHKTVPSSDFTALKGAETKAQRDLFDYILSVDEQHRSQKGSQGTMPGTFAARVVALSVLAHWLGILESFTPSSPANPSGSHRHGVTNELALLFVDNAALTTGERLRTKCDRIIYVSCLIRKLWEDGSTSVPDVDYDLLQSLGALLSMAQDFPAALIAKVSPLLRFDDVEANEDGNAFSGVAAAVKKYEATIEAIDQQEADLSLMLTTYHDSVGLLSQRIAELNDQNSDNLSWEESAELERHQDEERERLEALNHQWNERDNTRAAISQARVDAERQLDTIEQQFALVVEADKKSSVVSVLNEAFASLHDSHMQVQEAMEQADGLNPGSEVHRLLASVRTRAKELFLGEKIKMIHAVLVSLRQHTTMDHNIDLVIHHLEESARSFSEHYLAQVFVPAVRYAVSRFIRTQYRAVTKDNLPASVRSAALLSGLEKRKALVRDPALVANSDALLRKCIAAHEALVSAEMAHKRHLEALSASRRSLEKNRQDLVRLRWIREDALHLNDPLPVPTSPAATLAKLHSCPPGLTPPIPARAQILVDMKHAADLLSTTERSLQSCEKAYMALENDLSQRLSQITPASSRQQTQMAQLQAYLETIRKRRQNTASLHDKRTKLVRLCLVVLDFEAARWQLPESIRTKHAPIVTHYQQTFNNHQIHRLELNQLGAQLELISAEKAVMHKSNADLATRAEVLASQLRALEQKARLASSMFTSSGGELKQHALKSVEETQGVLQQNDRLMGEVLSLLASIMRLTEGMAGVEDIHASAEGLLCDQKTLHTELAAFLEQVAELLADKLSAQAIIPAEPFLILVQQFVAAVEYLYHQCVAVGFSFKSIASAQMEDVEHNPRAEDKKESAASAATSTEEAAPPPPEENGVYEEDDEDEEEVDDEEEEEGEEDEGREHGPASARKDPERVFPSFSRLPIGAWATVPLQQTHGSAVGQESGAGTNAPPMAPVLSGEIATVPQTTAQPAATPAPKQSGRAAAGPASAAKGAVGLGQERNVHAVGVLKRVKAKLEGNDNALHSGDSGEQHPSKLTIPRQVELVIQQATNPDLLCQMYEGWTSWI